MKSVVLTPYCPLPADHGGKVEMWKHLDLLRTMGGCTIASAALAAAPGFRPDKSGFARRFWFFCWRSPDGCNLDALKGINRGLTCLASLLNCF